MQPAAVQVTEVSRDDDARIVREARAGNAAAFEAIVATRLPGAFRVAAAILGNQAEAADAAQDALVAAWRELPRLRDAGAFDAWFHRIVVNECRMRLRRNGRARIVPLDAVGASDARVEVAEGALLTRVEALEVLERAFETLDADDRAMVVLHHLEDRPLQEIAAALHMPVGTVKWRLHEARQTLHRALEADR